MKVFNKKVLLIRSPVGITKSGLNSKSDLDERPNYSVAALYCRKTRLVDLYKDYIVSNRQ